MVQQSWYQFTIPHRSTIHKNTWTRTHSATSTCSADKDVSASHPLLSGAAILLPVSPPIPCPSCPTPLVKQEKPIGRFRLHPPTVCHSLYRPLPGSNWTPPFWVTQKAITLFLIMYPAWLYPRGIRTTEWTKELGSSRFVGHPTPLESERGKKKREKDGVHPNGNRAQDIPFMFDVHMMSSQPRLALTNSASWPRLHALSSLFQASLIISYDTSKIFNTGTGKHESFIRRR